MGRQIPLSDASLPAYLARAGLIRPGEPVEVEPIGDGNINWVRRFRTRGSSLVVKQARPALERFPEYLAPTDRIAFEARYFECAAPFDSEGICPRIFSFDPEQCVLVIEDLGAAERLDDALARGADVAPAAAALGAFLGRVHAGTRGAGLAARFANDGMRALHGEHIFSLPFRPNGFPLSPALARRAREIAADAALVARIDAAHARYREPRGALVHGDVQSANVMLAAAGPKLLDAEIAHVGDPAFDIGQLVAHLLLPSLARAEPAVGRRAAVAAAQAWLDSVGPPGADAFADAAVYAGIELLRRTLGAARATAVARDEAGLAVVDAGLRLVLAPPRSPEAL